jgi:serine/threonine protein kinase
VAAGTKNQWVIASTIVAPLGRVKTNMDHREALAILGLTDSPDRKVLEHHYDIRRNELAERLTNAPTDGLRAKYQAALGDLVAAYTWLNEEREPVAVAGISKTQLDDLPSASPSYTRDGTGAHNAPAFSPGQVIANRYEVRELIGQGGMGSVYRAFDRTKGEEIALKVMLPTLLTSEQAKQRLLSEGKISINLSHPNIVNVFDVQQTGEYFFLTMELLKGQTLRQLLKQTRMTAEAALTLAQAIEAALTYAHQFTIHRDIKPENIWVSHDGSFKLMDFGIAKAVTGSSLTLTRTEMGSAYYMAPEQIKDSKNIDGRADQFSLAVVLYEAVAGELPAGRAKSLVSRVRGVSRSFSMAVDRAMEPLPEARFSDMKRFIDALSGRGFSLRQHPAAPYIVGGVALLALFIVTMTLWPHLRAFLPDTAAADRAREEAVRSQAALGELMKGLDTQQRNIDEHAREAQSTIDRLVDRFNSARNEQEKNSLRQQMSQAQSDWQIAATAKKTADGHLFSVDTMATLKADQALGETRLRDGHFAAAAATLGDARTRAEHILVSAQNLQPAYTFAVQSNALFTRATSLIRDNGGDPSVILYSPWSAAKQASQALDNGDPAAVIQQQDAITTDVKQRVREFLDEIINNYSVLSQKKMAENDLQTAENALNKAKALQQEKANWQ